MKLDTTAYESKMKKTIEDIKNNLSENTPLWQKKSSKKVFLCAT